MHAPFSDLQSASTDAGFCPSRRGWISQLLSVPLAAPLTKSGTASLAAMFLTACGDGAVDLSVVHPDYQPVIRSTSAALREELAKKDLAGAGFSIALVDGPDIVWTEGFGVAQASTQRPATPATRYEAGSITKLFTATAVMKLVEQGLVDLDLPIDRYVPGFRIRSRWDLSNNPITARLLLTHRAGIPEELLTGGYADRSRTLAETTALLAGETLAYLPGTLHAYSNLGYAVLGRLIECVSGIPYARYVEQRILQPLGMQSSLMQDPAAQAAGGVALADGVGYPAPEDVAPRWVDNGIADGGLRSTVQDLAKFASACLQTHAGKPSGGMPLHQASLAEMWRMQFSSEVLDFEQQMGLAWHIAPQGRDASTRQELRAVLHGGTSVHHQSVLALLPEHGLGIVAMCNHSDSGGLVNTLALHALREAASVKSGLKLQPLGKPVLPVFMQSRDLRRHAGYYVTLEGQVIRLLEDAGTLVMEYSGAPVGVLVEQADGFLRDPSAGEGSGPLAFDQLRGLQLLLQYDKHGRRRLSATRLETLPHIPADWRARLGTYALPSGQRREILQTVRLFMTDDAILRMAMTAPHSGKGEKELDLAPDTAGTALVMGLGRGRQETVRVGSDSQGDFITVSGITLHRVAQA